VTAIREVLPRPFVLGVKLSSSDYVGAGSVQNARAEEEAEDRAVSHVVDVARWGMIDFIEISGGDYENPGTDSFRLPSLVTLKHTYSISYHGPPSLSCALCP
jgi:2,4-dienoyl-CoA reductase-like NADH-dependent reductase (Old Yellow Enzyme family)